MTQHNGVDSAELNASHHSGVSCCQPQLSEDCQSRHRTYQNGGSFYDKRQLVRCDNTAGRLPLLHRWDTQVVHLAQRHMPLLGNQQTLDTLPTVPLMASDAETGAVRTLRVRATAGTVEARPERGSVCNLVAVPPLSGEDCPYHSPSASHTTGG